MKTDLFRRDSRRLFRSPLFWSSLAVVHFLSGMALFRGDYLFSTGILDLSSSRDMILPLMILLIPLFTAPAWSSEFRRGTDRLLLTGGKSLWRILLEKGSAPALFPLAVMLMQLGRWLFLGRFLAADPGSLLAQSIGLILFFLTLTALGLFFSVVVRHRLAAWFLTVGVAFPWLYLRPGNLPYLPLRKLIRFVSLGGRIDSFMAGYWDFSDLASLLVLTLLLFGAGCLVLGRRQGHRKELLPLVQWGTPLLMLCLLIGSTGFIVDYRYGGLHRFSSTTRSLMEDIRAPVYVEWYRTDPEHLSAGYLKEGETFLRQWARFSRGKVKLRIKTATDQDTDKLSAQGFLPISRDGGTIWSGLVMEYGGEKEVIPFWSADQDAEFRLAVALRTMSGDPLPPVGVISGDMRTSPERAYTILLGALDDILPVYVLQTGNPVPETLSAVILLGQDTLNTNDLMLLERFRRQGGDLVVCASGLSIDPERNGVALEYEISPLDTYLSDRGIDLVSALAAQESSYPLQLETEAGLWLWGSPVYPLSQKDNPRILLTTRNDAWLLTGSFPLEPDKEGSGAFFNPGNRDRGSYPLGVVVQPKEGGELAVLGSQWSFADFSMRTGNHGAIRLLRNTVLEMAGEYELVGLIKKDLPPKQVFPDSESLSVASSLVRLSETVLIPAMLIAIGLFIYMVRRWKTR